MFRQQHANVLTTTASGPGRRAAKWRLVDTSGSMVINLAIDQFTVCGLQPSVRPPR